MVELLIEASKSRKGLHAERKLVLVIDASGSVKRIEKGEVSCEERVYSKGYCQKVKLDLREEEYAVQVRLVKNSKGHVSGYFKVYNHRGVEVLFAVLRRKKIRRSRGDPRYSWIIERVVGALGLDGFIRRFNWNTGG